MHTSTTHHTRTRRAAAVAAIIILLAMVHLTIVASIRPAAADIFTVENRVQSLRALHAAESGARVVLKALIVGANPPPAGTIVPLPQATFEIISTPPPAQAGEVVIEGRAGNATKRLSILVL